MIEDDQPPLAVKRHLPNKVASSTSDEAALKMFWKVLIGVVITWAAMLLTSLWAQGWTKSHQIGDSMNIVGSFFSGAALAAISVSIVIQRGDFKKTMEEMRQTRGEMEKAQKLQERPIEETRRGHGIQLSQIRMDRRGHVLQMEEIEMARLAAIIQADLGVLSEAASLRAMSGGRLPDGMKENGQESYSGLLRIRRTLIEQAPPEGEQGTESEEPDGDS